MANQDQLNLGMQVVCLMKQNQMLKQQNAMKGVGFFLGGLLLEALGCWRRLNSDPPCRSNIDPGRIAEFGISNCG